MYNLSVDTAHTFFVGEGQWLVHNCGEDFVPGTVFEKTFKTKDGDYFFAANTRVDGKTLYLEDVVAYPTAGGTPSPGISAARAGVRELAEQARVAGFDELVISGMRYKDGKPVRMETLTIPLGGKK
jgi:hypothetical protein